VADNYINLPVEGGSSGVVSLNGLTGALTLVAGSGISITPLGTNITIAATGSGFVPTSRTINTTAPLAGGGNLSADLTLSIPKATSLVDGYLSAADWSTFNAKQAALTPGSISTTTTGITVGSGANSTVGPNVTVDVQTASGSQPGLLSAADWTTFNNKQAALSFPLAVNLGGTGVVASSGASSVMLRDASQNTLINAIDQSIAIVATAGGTTTLTVASAPQQHFTGNLAQTVVLPDATTLTVGRTYTFLMTGANTLTINDNSGALVQGVIGGPSYAFVTLETNSTAAGTWSVNYLPHQSTAQTAPNTLVLRSGNSTVAGSYFVPALNLVTTAAGTTTLTAASAGSQVFTGSTTQTVTMPVVTTMTKGSIFWFHNRSSGVVTLQSSGGNTIKAMDANSSCMLSLTATSADTTAAPWDVTYILDNVTPVTSVSVVSANGFAGSSSGGTTPALTLSTTITGLLKGNGTAISAATSGTDYSAGTSALATGILKSTTTTGALSIAVAADFPTLNQNTTGTANNVTGIVALANGGTNANNTAANGGIAYSTASAIAIGAAGNDGEALVSAGAAAPVWTRSTIPRVAGPSTLRRQTVINEDWLTGALAGSYGWTSTVATGTVVANTANLDTTHWGIVTLTSGAASTNAALLSLNTGLRPIVFGAANVYIEMLINLSRLGTASTDDYICRMGLFDNWTGLPNNGIWFDYNVTGNATGANWYRSTANGGARTQTNSTVAVATGWLKLAIKVTGSSTAEFFVNDVSIGTNNANLPAGACYPAFGITKGANGTTNTTLLVDYFSLYANWSTDR
jgi:hypothetical protein